MPRAAIERLFSRCAGPAAGAAAAARLRLAAVGLAAAMVTASCSYTSEALWPSLTASEPGAPTGAPEMTAPAPQQVAAAPAPSRGAVQAPQVQASPPPFPTVQSQGADVGQQARFVRAESQRLLNSVQTRGGQMLQVRGEALQAVQRYETTVATINSRLAIGTTPGNPALQQQLNQASAELDRVSGHVGRMQQMVGDANSDSAAANAMLRDLRPLFNMPGAMESDHQALVSSEDDLSRAVVLSSRQVRDLNADVTRLATYVERERRGIGPLAQAIQTGDRYGSAGGSPGGSRAAIDQRPLDAPSFRSSSASVSSRPSSIRSAPPPARATRTERTAAPSAPARAAASPANEATGRRPLVVVRFDRADPAYEQPLYTALTKALERRPGARFDVVAVARTQSQVSQARGQANRVMRTILDMGMPQNRLNSSWITSSAVRSNEVHVYVR